MTKCDSIKDLSLYDDSNPNHLHYSCPICRGEDLAAGGSKGSSNGFKKTPNNNNNGRSLRSPDPIRTRNNSFYGSDSNSDSELEEDSLAGRLESVEKELLDKINEMYNIESIEDDEIREKLRNQEFNFSDDISQSSAQLIGKREREWYKNQTELERQIKRLKEEKEKLDDKIEMELVQDLKNHFRKQKKEFERQREKVFKSKTRTKDDLYQ